MTRSGSPAARRAVRRWAWRLFRREWRQQMLALGLISFAVAAATLGTIAAYNATPSRDAEFGAADHRFELGVSRPEAVAGYLDAARDWFGTIEAIGHRQVAVPGSTATIELRSMDDGGAYSGPMSAVRSGRAPASTDEIAVTDGVASTLGVGVGDSLVVADRRWTVVGLVENQADLDDEFARVVPAASPSIESLTLLVRADPERASSFRPPVEPGDGFLERREASEKTTAAVVTVVIATVALVLVALVAGASFVTLAHRRLRQLGMLAAVGATPRQLRRAMVTNGAAVGAVAAVVGTVVGLLAWLAIAPLLESAAAHRIDRLDIPVWLPAVSAMLAVLTATAAAWWPARTVAKVPTTDALAARPPRARRARRSAAVAAALFVAGLGGIATGVDPRADEAVPLHLIPGVVAVVAAILIAGAPILRGLARLAGRLPVGTRLAVRDLARFEARSSAALGAITLGIAIAVSVVVLAAAAAPDADEGNLDADQVIVWTSTGGTGLLQVPEVSDADVDRYRRDLARILAELPQDATVVPLQVALDPTNPEVRGGQRLLNTAVLGRRVNENTLRDSGLVFAATPVLLDLLGVDDGALGDDTLVLTPQTEDVYITGNTDNRTFRTEPVPAHQVEHIDVDDHSSVPRTLLTEAGMDAAGLEPAFAGWLVDLADRPDDAAIARARDLAAGAGLAIEVRDDEARTTIRTIATALGVLVALSILAMTEGLLRSETGRDLRALEATGATRRTRRALTASTCGVLAATGVVLAIGASYGAILAGYWPDTDRLGHIPLPHLAAIGIGLPILATVLAWLFAGRDQPNLNRTLE
jgi:putative ABC transport system permease protein